MLKRNLITFICHIAIITNLKILLLHILLLIVSGRLLNLSYYFQPFDLYYEAMFTLIFSLIYYFIGTRIKKWLFVKRPGRIYIIKKQIILSAAQME